MLACHSGDWPAKDDLCIPGPLASAAKHAPFFLTALLTLTATSAVAESDKVLPKYSVMDMKIYANHDPHSSAWIALQGPIGVGSAAKFSLLVRSLKGQRLPVMVSSIGGSVKDAMAIGRMIRAEHLDVAVSRTVPASCPWEPSSCEAAPHVGVVSVSGTADSRNALCASACSFILAAGERRFVPPRAYVGVHQFRSYRTLTRTLKMYRVVKRNENGTQVEVSRTLISERPISRQVVPTRTPEATYDKAQAFFLKMGIAPSLMTLAEATKPDTMHWLSPGELTDTRMQTDQEDGAYLVSHPAPASIPAIPLSPTRPMTATATGSAVLESHDPSAARQFRSDGHADWAIGAGPAGPVLEANVTLAAGMGGATVRVLERDTSPGSPDYRLQVTIRPGQDAPLRDVLAVGLPVVRSTSGSAPIELAATVSAPASNTFDIDLTSGKAEGLVVEQRLAASAVWEFPLIGLPIGTYRLELGRGPAVQALFRHWRDLAEAKRRPLPSPTAFTTRRRDGEPSRRASSSEPGFQIRG